MGTLMLVLVFAAAIGVSVGVVAVFADPLDRIVSHAFRGEEGPSWAMYAKFALFVTALKGGLHIDELETFAQQAAPSASTGLVEIYRAAAGSLFASACALALILCAAFLARYASAYVPSAKPEASHARDGHDWVPAASRR